MIYGAEGFKCHSKICLITLRGRNKTSYLTQIGTGNYNEKTNAMYTDLCLMTADQTIGEDAAAFSTICLSTSWTAHISSSAFRPLASKEMLLQNIDRQIALGQSGYVCIKANSVTEREVIDKLAAASRAGVEVQLIIRGICCILPGVAGETENIHVTSVVGRFLEHGRIYQFGRGDDTEFYFLRRSYDAQPQPPRGDRLPGSRYAFAQTAQMDSGFAAPRYGEGRSPVAGRQLLPQAQRRAVRFAGLFHAAIAARACAAGQGSAKVSPASERTMKGGASRMKQVFRRLAFYWCCLRCCYRSAICSGRTALPICSRDAIPLQFFRSDTAEDYSYTITKEIYSTDSPELKQIMDILSHYTYHRSFRTLAGANNTGGNHAGFWLHIYLDHGDDRVDFTCGGTGEISSTALSGTSATGGDRAELAMMAELAAVLEQ